ncbi:hypothetical protein GCM10007147_04680 [Nocardiopsis kunsanensis]|uniref:Uncharacterized protein n=1 Tax=Nocardiopsis kunsanensis TaxID=141693 RepID=A0A919CEW0_9ACTN|nr:hypothetical protein [Nocardiopsis kunsanensis]GHD16501.1 hypothetical protein GCM10007147_04680 [Nocardiopsis kunsanensis]
MSRASRPGQTRPTAVITIAPDERSAEIHIEGHRQVVTGQVPTDTRRAALDTATEYAARIGLPVLIDARDANGYWRLVATPDGVVQSAEHPEEEPPLPSRPGTDPADGRAGRGMVIIGAAAVALALVAGVGIASWHLLPGESTASTEDPDAPALGHPAPAGFADTVVFDHVLAPGSRPGVSRDGEQIAFVDPDERLNLLSADGTREWAADLPVDGAEIIGVPRFVLYDGDPAVVLETSGELLFWPVGGGAPDSVELGTESSPQYVGESVLVRSEDERHLASGGELVEVGIPEGGGAMLADGDRVLVAVAHGPWSWVDPAGAIEEVDPRRPDEAGEMLGVVTALREYVVVRWEALRGDGEYLAFHDSGTGEPVGGAGIAEGALEDAEHRSGPIGTETLAYGPAVVDPENGESTVVDGFEPTVAVGPRVYGELGGSTVAVGTDGEPTELDEGAQVPVGLLGEHAVVVHDEHLYAIPPR